MEPGYPGTVTSGILQTPGRVGHAQGGGRITRPLLLGVTLLFAATGAAAQDTPTHHQATAVGSRTRWWAVFATGFASSILAHEAGHVAAAYAVGGKPSFGFNEGRPTIYSGIDATLEPHKQFVFSSAGLTVQSVLDEGILDTPHQPG